MPRDRVVQLRADSADVAAWQARADAAGLSLSEYTRRALDAYGHPGQMARRPTELDQTHDGTPLVALVFSSNADRELAAEILWRCVK